MAPKRPARKSVKKEMPKTEPSAGIHTPKIKAEVFSPTPAFAANFESEKSPATPANDTTNALNTENIKSEFLDDLSLSPNLFPCTEGDITLNPCPKPGINSANPPTFSSQNRHWEWIFLPSNTDTESSPFTIKMEDIPAANPRIQRPSKSISSTANLGRLLFARGVPDSDDDISSVPSLGENITEQANTAKHVRFFMNTSHNKHFIPIDVPLLLSNEDWEYWLTAMLLLFRQHSVWPIVTMELQPLTPDHNLYLWYQRMRDCAIELIFANVSEEVRDTPCFVSTVREGDPNVVMCHLFAHYASPDSDHSHDESESD